MIHHILRSASVIVCVGIQRGMQSYVICSWETSLSPRSRLLRLHQEQDTQKYKNSVAPLRKDCYPQGNKGLKLADGNKQNLAYRYYCCTVGASALTLSNPEPLKFLKGCNVVISENGCNSTGYDYFPYASDSYLLSWDCQIKL